MAEQHPTPPTDIHDFARANPELVDRAVRAMLSLVAAGRLAYRERVGRAPPIAMAAGQLRAVRAVERDRLDELEGYPCRDCGHPWLSHGASPGGIGQCCYSRCACRGWRPR